MRSLERERRDLTAADRHIAEGRLRVRRQITMVRELRADGQDITQALRLLAALRGALAVDVSTGR